MPDGTTRQRLFLKRFFLKKNCFFAECSALALGKNSNFAECQSLGTRQSRRQMLTAVIFLPSAGLALGKDFAECRFLALGKEIFADKIFAERPLPSVALGKAFAECLAGFAECPQHSAKRVSAVVTVPWYGVESMEQIKSVSRLIYTR